MSDPETPDPHQNPERRQVLTRWQNQQLQAKREGYKNAWARRKAMGQATYVPQRGPRRRPGMQPEWTTPMEPRSRLDRLAGGHGPVKAVPVSEWRERPATQPRPDMRHLARIWK